MNNEFIFFLIISAPVPFYYIYKYFSKLNESNRWKELAHTPFPKEYELILEKSFRPYRFFTEEEKKRFNLKVSYFLKYKNFHSIGDFEIKENMKLIIAAQACLLILNIDTLIYPSLKNIFISASVFNNKENFINQNTLELNHSPRLGESWKDGPIVLSWSSVRAGVVSWRDGQNVVLHEFAHQLDGSEGAMNGVPELQATCSYKRWKILMSKEFFDLRNRLTHQLSNDIDNYASTNPSEFFAVTVEEFFEKSANFKKKHPELFKLYQDYFKINPLKWQ